MRLEYEAHDVGGSWPLTFSGVQVGMFEWYSVEVSGVQEPALSVAGVALTRIGENRFLLWRESRQPFDLAVTGERRSDKVRIWVVGKD